MKSAIIFYSGENWGSQMCSHLSKATRQFRSRNRNWKLLNPCLFYFTITRLLSSVLQMEFYLDRLILTWDFTSDLIGVLGLDLSSYPKQPKKYGYSLWNHRFQVTEHQRTMISERQETNEVSSKIVSGWEGCRPWCRERERNQVEAHVGRHQELRRQVVSMKWLRCPVLTGQRTKESHMERTAKICRVLHLSI